MRRLEGSISVCDLFITSVEHRHVARLAEATLPAKVLEKSENRHQLSDRMAFLAGRLMIQQFIGSIDLLQKKQFGKPYLLGKPCFNLSHSGGLLLFAISKQGEIGVDAEQELPIELNDFQSVLHSNEKAYIQSSSKRFFEIWCRKEALLKCLGIGLHDHMNRIDVTADLHYDDQNYYGIDMKIGNHYQASMVWAYPAQHLQIHWGSFQADGFVVTKQMLRDGQSLQSPLLLGMES